MSSTRVDLTKLAGPVFSGRDRGIAARAEFNLDEIDRIYSSVEVVLPSTLYTLTSSFFLGLFGESVRKCGSVTSFEEKFKFSGPPFLAPILRSHAGLALRSKNLLS